MTSQPSGKTTRRTILKAGIVATATAPIYIPAHVIGKPGRPGANDKIGLGFIGVGRQGGGLMNAHYGNPIVAVADVNLPRAQQRAKKHNATAYQDYRKLLERKDVDAIVTATPDHWRALVCIHAAQAGKDIYAEKPMTLTIAEGRKVVQAVRKYKRVFQTGSQQRSMKENMIGCAMIRNGRLGKVQRVIANHYPSPWPCRLPGQEAPEGIDWDMWCGPTELRPYHEQIYRPRAQPGWISFQEWSGGEITGWGSHGFDQIQSALGMDESGPVKIWTEGEALDPPILTEPHGRGAGEKHTRTPKVFMQYANGAVMELGRGPLGGGEFHGEKGVIRIDRGSLKSDPKELTAEPIDRDQLPGDYNVSHYQNFYNCIKSRQRPIADVEIGHRSATVCHLANIARWLGRELKWDPKAEHFVGDNEANGLLDRPRRKGYELPDRV